MQVFLDSHKVTANSILLVCNKLTLEMHPSFLYIYHFCASLTLLIHHILCLCYLQYVSLYCIIGSLVCITFLAILKKRDKVCINGTPTFAVYEVSYVDNIHLYPKKNCIYKCTYTNICISLKCSPFEFYEHLLH